MSNPSLPDTLSLWYLGEPHVPVLVGELNLVMGRRGVSLKYAPSWLAHGFALSEDLPLLDVEHFPREKDTAAGAVDDARPVWCRCYGKQHSNAQKSTKKSRVG